MRMSSVRSRQVAPFNHIFMNEVLLEETEAGELFFKLPDEMIERLGWTEGCNLEFVIYDDTSFMIRKEVAQSDE